MVKLVKNAVVCKGCGRTIQSKRRGQTVEHKCDKNRNIRFTVGGGPEKLIRTVKFGSASDNYTEASS